MSKESSRNAVGIILLLCVFFGVFYGFYKYSNLKKENVDLKSKLEVKESELNSSNSKRSETEVAKNLAEDKNEQLSLTLSVVSESAKNLAGIADRLDTLILSDDSKNREFINWLIKNSKFNTYDGTLAEANIRKTSWEEYMQTSDAEYGDIKKEIDDLLTGLKKQMEVIEYLDTSAKPKEL